MIPPVFLRPVRVLRVTPPVLGDDGEYQQAAAVEDVIQASVQPASKADLDSLQNNAELERVEFAIRLYTPPGFVLQVAGEGAEGDVVFWETAGVVRHYRVRARADWTGTTATMLQHYRYLAVSESRAETTPVAATVDDGPLLIDGELGVAQ